MHHIEYNVWSVSLQFCFNKKYNKKVQILQNYDIIETYGVVDPM